MKILAFALFATLAAPALAGPLPRPAAAGVCAACHRMAVGEKSGLGPNLWGVGGRVAGTLPDAHYSAAMKASGIKWSKPALTAFVMDPRKSVPGTTMGFAGIKDPTKAAEIADYLMSLR